VIHALTTAFYSGGELQAQQSTHALKLQRAIERIAGVTSAKVTIDTLGDIAEIHLVGSPSRRPKQIVRDTESLLYAQFGVRVDYRRISLVQVDPTDDAPTRTRLRLSSVEERMEPNHQVSVTLLNGAQSWIASENVSDNAHAHPTMWAAAQATIAAVQRASGRMVQLDVQDLRMITTEGRNVCLVIVKAQTESGEEGLTGTCIIASCGCMAAAKATLDAINRRLQVWA
jgi:hypothetical protein